MKTSHTLLATALFSLCSWSAYANTVSNFNEPNFSALQTAFQQKNVHIVQLGDSHTAGDSLTDAVRQTLQAQLGNGGMGWAMPMYFSGQRLVRFGYDNQAWQPVSSRSNSDENYTLGGLIAKPLQQGATLTIKAKKPNEDLQHITVSIRQSAYDGAFTGTDANGQTFKIEAPRKDGTWQHVQFTAQLPFTIRNDNASQSAIGGWWAKSANQAGAVVSALGINGAELSYWNRWNQTALLNEFKTIQPQLVVLAYGTNEAYNNVSPSRVKEILTQRIQQIRQASPNSAIMIASAPEALKNLSGSCGTRPMYLSEIQQVQRQVAQEQRTLLWDWQAAMGGECSMKNWIANGNASKDGVHFTHTGYTQLGQQMANDLLQLTTGKRYSAW
ncbi:MAG: GDSL-type esterase/lipase family protein [Acinetobacter sp.]|nr:GDSL-type esterase/lipase family protein [Acinetobacter sp.]